jgi:hypothetical protein
MPERQLFDYSDWYIKHDAAGGRKVVCWFRCTRSEACYHAGWFKQKAAATHRNNDCCLARDPIFHPPIDVHVETGRVRSGQARANTPAFPAAVPVASPATTPAASPATSPASIPVASPAHAWTGPCTSPGHDWAASPCVDSAHKLQNGHDSSVLSDELGPEVYDSDDPAPDDARAYAGPLVDNIELEDEDLAQAEHEVTQVRLSISCVPSGVFLHLYLCGVLNDWRYLCIWCCHSIHGWS